MAPNQYILAADNSPALLPLLRSQPELAAQQDEHGYSLIHAAASYNHLDLLRQLVNEFHVPVDLRDEDAETALFVVETVDAARCLVEELGLDASIRGDLGLTAAEKISGEEEFPLVAAYLQGLSAAEEDGAPGPSSGGAGNTLTNGSNGSLPPPPEGLSVTVGTMPAPSDGASGSGAGEQAAAEPVPELRRRIDELAQREDFHTPEGQAALRRLVEDALSDQGLTEDRNVRARQE